MIAIIIHHQNYFQDYNLSKQDWVYRSQVGAAAVLASFVLPCIACLSQNAYVRWTRGLAYPTNFSTSSSNFMQPAFFPFACSGRSMEITLML
jgi:hypothetical protein